MERWLYLRESENRWPLIKPNSIEYRDYQIRIALSAIRANTLIVLPTGLGKTIIAALVMGLRLDKEKQGKCIILAPTKPLAVQHAETLRKIMTLNPDEINVLTGSLAPKKRIEVWKRSRIVSMTPQTLKNDIIANRYSLKDVVLIVFDEAHRAVGNYPYVFIAERYIEESEKPLILAMTASPGSSEEKIKEICKNLFIRNIEVRSEYSPDVRRYVQPIEIEWRMVDLDERFKQIRALIVHELRVYLEELKERGYIESKSESKTRLKDILEAKAFLQDKLREYITPPRELIEDLVKLNFVTRLIHALELLEAQGLHALGRYMNKLEELAKRRGGNRILKEFVNSATWFRIKEIIRTGKNDVPHPKVRELLKLLRKNLKGTSKAIIFTNYRDTVDLLVDILKENGYRVTGFIGQARRGNSTGLSQKEQERIMQAFKNGMYNVLVATQVAEEGIDVAECDLVIFYDNVPSAIRFIQRKGRTGRRRAGKVIVLISRNTRDEAYYWASIYKQRKMYSVLRKLKVSLKDVLEGKQQTLEMKKNIHKGALSKLVVYVDNREMASDIVTELAKYGIRIIPKNLEVADYVVSEDVAIERKSLEDFARSIIDLRIFKQAKLLKQSYRSPIIIIEGKKLAVGMRQEALVGALLSLIVDFNIPVIWTETPFETAKYIVALAKKEQKEKKKTVRIKGERKPLTLEEIQIEMLSSIPGIDSVLAKRLLEKFRTIRNIANASIREIMRVEGIGEKLAESIFKAFRHEYQPNY